MYVCFKMLTIPPELAECNHFPKALDRHAFQVHTPQLPLTAQRFSSVFPFCFNVAIQLYIRASTFAVRPPSEQYATSFKKKTTGCHSYVIQDLFWLSDSNVQLLKRSQLSQSRKRREFSELYFDFSKLLLIMVSLQWTLHSSIETTFHCCLLT